MILYRVRHETRYDYAAAVSVSHNVAHLLPRERSGQRLEHLALHIAPTPSCVRWFDDYFGNPAVFFIVDEPHESLLVRAESRVELGPPGAPVVTDSRPWEEVVRAVREARGDAELEALEFVFESPFVPTSDPLRAFAAPSFERGRPVLDGAHDLCRRIHREFRYDAEATTLATPTHEALEARHGVCQDFAHVMIGALRSLGIPARYVSGYIRSRPPHRDEGRGEVRSGAGGEARPERVGDEAHPDPELVGADASHAWVSVFCPRFGWVDFDPTNDLMPSERHVTLGWGRDYDDVSPLQGVTLGGGLQTVTVAVTMRPAEEPTA